MMNEKFAELLKNEEFAAKLFSLDEADQVQALLKDNGVELSLEDIQAIRKELASMLPAEEGELGEDDLEGVAGGAFADRFIKLGLFFPGLNGPLDLGGHFPKPTSRW